ncbi:hypothetical protein ACFB49_45610 [Sphingomonas sp. DBB INV C78]|uniref:PilZ domain-containing protein n=1 Tax=Sphingomonas sp. DBB INV C78 TaxID=3349434 RepID=UPI0036D3C3B4
MNPLPHNNFDAADDAWMPARTAPLLTPRAPRTMTLLLIGRVTSDRFDALCCIRNLSEGGLKAEVRAKFTIGEAIRIEFRNGDVVTGAVRWTDRKSIGVQFDSPIDVDRLLAESSTVRRPSNLPQPRSPRMPTNCRAEIRVTGKSHRVALTDLSQGGAKLETKVPLAKDDMLTLAVPGLEPMRAVVRWVRGEAVGIAFMQSIAFATLAEWLNDPKVRYDGARLG